MGPQFLALAAILSSTSHCHGASSEPLYLGVEDQILLSFPAQGVDPVPFSTRAHWMRRANEALADISPSPCPFAAFGSVVVNHTDTSSLGDLICMGVNSGSTRGDPTLHGEIATIRNCSEVLQGPGFGLSPAEALLAFQTLSLYTNAEACPMCASAIRWAGFREYIYGTSIDKLIGMGWGQIRMSSREIFDKSHDLPSRSRFVGSVLANETDAYFSWQYDSTTDCPPGCRRGESSGCVAS